MKTLDSFRTPWFLRIIKRHLQSLNTSFKHLSFSPIATFMTFAVIGIALALPMGLFVFVKNAQAISTNLHDSSQISIYLHKNISPQQLKKTQQLLRTNRDVSQIHYISPEKGLASFEKTAGFGKVISELKENPLPGVLVVTPSPQIKTKLSLEQLINRLQRLPNVKQVQLDMAWLQRLHAIIKLTKRVSYAIMILLAIAVLLIIGNTIRLTTQHYRNEIMVIKLLGGTDNFVRRPFLYSGMLYGFVGGIIAWLLVDSLVLWIAGPVEKLAGLYGSTFQIQGLDAHSAAWLLLGGIILGYCGSWLATNRHMKIFEP